MDYEPNTETTEEHRTKFATYAERVIGNRLKAYEQRLVETTKEIGRLKAQQACNHEDLGAYYGPVEDYNSRATKLKCPVCGFAYWP